MIYLQMFLLGPRHCINWGALHRCGVCRFLPWPFSSPLFSFFHCSEVVQGLLIMVFNSELNGVMGSIYIGVTRRVLHSIIVEVNGGGVVLCPLGSQALPDLG